MAHVSNKLAEESEAREAKLRSLMDRPFDLVIYGASGAELAPALADRSGFTGRLACRHVAQNCPTSLKWAVGGRSQAKLQTVVDEVQALNVNRVRPGILIADSGDIKALADIAKSTRVIVSAAGPFAKSSRSYDRLIQGMEVS